MSDSPSAYCSRVAGPLALDLHTFTHGYIELIFAVTCDLFGLLFISVSLLCAYNHINWPLRVLAAILLIVVLYRSPRQLFSCWGERQCYT